MMNFKKSMAILLAATTIATTVPVSTVFAAEDTTAPVINAITLADSTTEYGIGDTVNISFDITEEETGISSANVTFYSVEEVSSFTVSADLSENDLSGTYTGSFTIPEGTRAGEWTSVSAYAVDKVGNEYSQMLNNSISITIINPEEEEEDKTAPTITDWSVKYDTLSLNDTQYVEFACPDDDLASVTFRVGCLDGGQGRNISSDITVNEDGNYEVPFTFTSSDRTGNWTVAYMYAYDTNGNKKELWTPLSFTVTDGEDVKEEEHDDTKPSITSVTVDKTDVTTPDYINVTISGTENVVGSTVSITAAIGNTKVTNGTRYVNGTAVVDEDGNWSTTIRTEFEKDMTASDNWKLYYVKATDEASNSKEVYEDFVVFNVTTSNETVDKEFSLSSPKLVENVKSMEDGSTILVNTDKSVVSSDVFSAIQGTNKTLVFNLNGVQWIFNGNDITNPKDVDLTMSIEEIDATEYGYDGNCVRLNFAPNGILPGKASIRIKSNYITKLYNLSSELYLAFIKDTAEVEEEVTYTDYEWPEDEDGNPIYSITTYLYYEDGTPVVYTTDEAFEELQDKYSTLAVDSETKQLYYTESVEPDEVEKIETINKTVDTYTRIEDAGITMDADGYITIELTHNSSYILSTSLPTTKSATAKKETISSNNNTTSNTSSNNNTNNSNDSKTTEQKVESSNNNSTAATVATPAANTTTENTAVVSNTESNTNTTEATATSNATVTSSNSAATTSKNTTTSNATSKKVNKYLKVSGKDKSIKVKFTAGSSKWKGYQLKVSTKKSMKNSTIYIGKSSRTISGLKANKTYYCRMRMYKMVNGKKVYSAWKTFTIHTA